MKGEHLRRRLKEKKKQRGARAEREVEGRQDCGLLISITMHERIAQAKAKKIQPFVFKSVQVNNKIKPNFTGVDIAFSYENLICNFKHLSLHIKLFIAEYCFLTTQVIVFLTFKCQCYITGRYCESLLCMFMCFYVLWWLKSAFSRHTAKQRRTLSQTFASFSSNYCITQSIITLEELHFPIQRHRKQSAVMWKALKRNWASAKRGEDFWSAFCH